MSSGATEQHFSKVYTLTCMFTHDIHVCFRHWPRWSMWPGLPVCQWDLRLEDSRSQLWSRPWSAPCLLRLQNLPSSSRSDVDVDAIIAPCSCGTATGCLRKLLILHLARRAVKTAVYQKKIEGPRCCEMLSGYSGSSILCIACVGGKSSNIISRGNTAVISHAQLITK